MARKVRIKPFYEATFSKMNKYIEETGIDIAFFDIDLGTADMDGIELTQKLREKNKDIVIIFATNHEEFALASYGVNGFGYLLKPITQSACHQKLKQAVVYINGLYLSTNKTVKFGKQEIIEKYIISIEIVGRNICVYTIHDSITTIYIPLTKLLDLLSDNFILIGRSVIINTKYVIHFDKSVVKLAKDRFYELPTRKASALYEQLKCFTNT